ncbi:hypothetical protein Tco_0589856 [Tanacetum coccineum]
MIGSLLYLTASRPDIMFSVCLCARFQEASKTSHLEAVKRIFRYIKGTTHLGLWYPKGTSIETVVYADSDHARDYVDRKSTSGYNVVPPPYTGNLMPPKPDLSFSGLEEFVNEPIVSEPTVKKPVAETSEVKASADKPKVVKKNNSALIIEEWVSDSEDEAVSKPKIEKKTVKPSFAKIVFVKSKEQV